MAEPELESGFGIKESRKFFGTTELVVFVFISNLVEESESPWF